eukprot:CAMPEP_0172153922 /NCGR_PEP_ID=MMETSP1050-20130122/1731_1 /TAXON_ID=233186 /ORGANISM="Cryptomonas curvata, Strain CCAP979/52" /LENGTH=141 /DNA_ID=CAMNT_0012822547 /DNA_START=38 /DNA_END=464 /DNA_ORIENTATION=+
MPVGDLERAQLECSLWDESESPKQTVKNDNFLGEVVLNLSKLRPFQGKYIEQVFEIKPSKLYRCDAQATGKLKLGLTLSVPAAGPSPSPQQTPIPDNPPTTDGRVDRPTPGFVWPYRLGTGGGLFLSVRTGPGWSRMLRPP